MASATTTPTTPEPTVPHPHSPWREPPTGPPGASRLASSRASTPSNASRRNPPSAASPPAPLHGVRRPQRSGGPPTPSLSAWTRPSMRPCSPSTKGRPAADPTGRFPCYRCRPAPSNLPISRSSGIARSRCTTTSAARPSDVLRNRRAPPQPRPAARSPRMAPPAIPVRASSHPRQPVRRSPPISRTTVFPPPK